MKKVLAIIITVCLVLSANSLISFAASPTVTVSVAEDSVYKNLYTVTDGTAQEDAAAVAVALENLAGDIDDNKTAYVAYAVYAGTAGDYSFTLNFSGADYTAVKVGETVKTVNSGSEFTLALSQGVNIITCFGAVSELADASVSYTSIVCEDSLYEIEGDFYLAADVNSDTDVNILDLIRMKKYLADTAEINTLAAELDGQADITSADMAIVRKCILGTEDTQGVVALQYNLTFVNRDNEVPDNWEF